MRTLLVYLLALGALAAAATFSFPELFGATAASSADDGARADALTSVIVAPAVRAPFADALDALGTVHANESVAITANRADHVVAIHFEDGQEVETGELLVEMHVEEEQALLAEASAIRDERRVTG